LDAKKVFHIPATGGEEQEIENLKSEAQQQAIQEAYWEEVIGQARKVKTGLENYREIMRLKRKHEELRF